MKNLMIHTKLQELEFSDTISIIFYLPFLSKKTEILSISANIIAHFNFISNKNIIKSKKIKKF